MAAVGGVCHGGDMDHRLSFVTLAVPDPAGFRWEVAFNPGPIGQEVLP